MSVSTAEARLGAVSGRPLALRATAAGERKRTYLDININRKLSFIMSFERHDEFWIKSYFGKVFHVLSVGEGFLAITLLCLGTWVAVRWLRR